MMAGGIFSPSAQIVTRMVMFSWLPSRCWCCSCFFANPITQRVWPPPGWNPVSSAAQMQSFSIFCVCIVLPSKLNHALLVCSLTARPQAESRGELQNCWRRAWWHWRKWSVQFLPTPGCGNSFFNCACKTASTWCFSDLWSRGKPRAAQSRVKLTICSSSSRVSHAFCSMLNCWQLCLPFSLLFTVSWLTVTSPHPAFCRHSASTTQQTSCLLRLSPSGFSSSSWMILMASATASSCLSDKICFFLAFKYARPTIGGLWVCIW